MVLDDPVDHISKHRTARASVGLASNFFMIKEGHDLCVLGWRRGQEARKNGVARAQIIESGRKDELVVQATEGWLLSVMKAELPAQHIFTVQLTAQPSLKTIPLTQPKQRAEVLLLVATLRTARFIVVVAAAALASRGRAMLFWPLPSRCGAYNLACDCTSRAAVPRPAFLLL